jgi:hypothetical protein
MSRVHILLLTLAISLPGKAQWKGVITNIETGVPLRDVTIYTDDQQKAVTNYKGEYQLKETFKSVTISHGQFLKVTIPREEMTDTIALLPRLTTIGEVVVWGEMPRVGVSTEEIAQDASAYGAHSPGMSFDFFSLFYKKHHMNKKQRQRHEEIIKEY